MIHCLKEPLRETPELLRGCVILILQTAVFVFQRESQTLGLLQTSILIAQSTHLVLQRLPQTRLSRHSYLESRQMRLQVRNGIPAKDTMFSLTVQHRASDQTYVCLRVCITPIDESVIGPFLRMLLRRSVGIRVLILPTVHVRVVMSFYVFDRR